MGDAERIPVGYVRRAHGIRGEVVVRPMTDRPGERFVPGAHLATDESPSRSLEVVAVARHRDGLIVTFRGIEDRTEASALKGTALVIDRSQRRRLEEGEYWPDDLVGCAVVDRRGDPVGSVADVVTGGAQDRLVIATTAGGSAEIPFVQALVPEVDLDRRRIVIDPPADLVD